VNAASVRSGAEDGQKRAAALRAVDEVEDGMVLGLGTGTTMAFVLDVLAARIAKGLKVVGIPTSNRTEDRAQQLGIPLTNFAAHRSIDLALDGADEVEEGSLNLIKGAGGALLREKIVAAASKRLVIIVDETKIVQRLGTHRPVPVEMASFGWQNVLDRLAAAGMAPTLRTIGGEPFRTDGGNYIADCAFAGIDEPARLDERLKAIVGVIESGIFVGLATRIVVGGTGGVTILERKLS